MESLLSVAFDNTSSKNPKRIGKGLRQIEGLLAQICLSSSQSSNKRLASNNAVSDTKDKKEKQLDALADDLAFREFFRLQGSFEWNVATRLVECLERLLGIGKSDQTDSLIAFALDLLQGLLLLHPPSRTLFSRERNMNLLLDLLDPQSSPHILTITLHALVVALLGHPQNTRVFESTSGILTLTSLFKSRAATQDVKLKVVEFFYFYLMHESPPPSQNLAASTRDASFSASMVSNSGGVAIGVQKSPTKSNQARSMSAETSSSTGAGAGNTKTTEEKQALLGKYFSNVEDLVQDLRENPPFTAVEGVH